MKVVEKYFEDFEIGEIRSTDARTITEADIVCEPEHVLYVEKKPST